MTLEGGSADLEESSASAPKFGSQSWYGSGSWATDPRYTLQEKLVRWQFWVMCRQRNIEWKELREELGGISAARLGQMLQAMTSSELVAIRLESAVMAITERRHAALCDCEDAVGCAVYTTVYGNDEGLVFGKKGELNEWRERHASVLTGSTQTASRQPS